MFPDFMNDMLSQARCGQCNAPQTPADIQIVGVRRPEEFEAFYGEGVFVIVMSCNACGQWTNYSMRRPRADSIAGCARFIDLIEQECQGKKPPLNIPGLEKKSKRTSTRAHMPQRAAEGSPRPSRRENQPDTPPTQREIQCFLHRLRKTSFKRNSKGFSDWMKDMGADGDARAGEDISPE